MSYVGNYFFCVLTKTTKYCYFFYLLKTSWTYRFLLQCRKEEDIDGNTDHTTIILHTTCSIFRWFKMKEFSWDLPEILSFFSASDALHTFSRVSGRSGSSKDLNMIHVRNILIKLRTYRESVT